MQLGLGLVHHSVYARSKKPTPFGRIHFLLGPFIIILGLINGGIGVGFASKFGLQAFTWFTADGIDLGNHALKIPYAVVVGLLFGFLLVASGLFLFLRSRRRYKPESRSQPDHSFAKQDDREMEIRETSFGEMSPPEPYELPIPYSPTVPAPCKYARKHLCLPLLVPGVDKQFDSEADNFAYHQTLRPCRLRLPRLTHP